MKYPKQGIEVKLFLPTFAGTKCLNQDFLDGWLSIVEANPVYPLIP
jgi:hypothetical protein